MAELHQNSHEHPLVFNEDSSSPSDTTYDCAGCAEKVSGSSYSCGECRFYLHKKCAEAPLEIQRHPAHPNHPLLLLPASGHQKTEVGCSICFDEVKGFIYHCSSCDFYLDFNCALLPHYTSGGKFTETLHVAHPHPLISINGFRYSECQGCRDPIKTDDASSACFGCRTFFHKKCLELLSKINLPCHLTHHLLLDFNPNSPTCSLCQTETSNRFVYHCVPCKFYVHVGCARPPPIIEDKSLHEHPFTLLLRPNDPFYCNACGDRGDYVSYICSTCNIQLHGDCTWLPRHIKLSLHPHPISHCFFICTDHHDSRTWDCRICYEKVNIDYGSYSCSRPGCDLVIHVNCYVTDTLYDKCKVENHKNLRILISCPKNL